jgi:probable rRNA maturation factor
MPTINFFEEDTRYNLKQKLKVKRWIKGTIAAEGYKLDELNYVFCSDAYLLQINQQYLNHDTYTDIVTFDNSEAESLITGDIFISIDRVKENALQYEVSTEAELHRVMIHGALHLLGYKDKSAKEKQLMTEKENHYLGLRNFL